MSTGFEALPPRDTGRLAKRRRMEAALATGSTKATPNGTHAQGVLSRSSGTESAGESSLHTSSLGVADLAYSKPAVAATTCFEYLDHTADVQLHSWGSTLGDAFCQTALAMYTYMSEPGAIKVDPACSRVIEARGHDVITLMFQFLDQCLFAFASDDFMACDMRVLALRLPFDDSVEQLGSAPAAGESAAGTRADCYIRVAAFGERFVVGKHPQGTEIKAITYSNMQIRTPAKLYTANDALDAASSAVGDASSVGPAAAAAAAGGAGSSASTAAAAAASAASVLGGSEPCAAGRAAPFEIFVIVDI